MPNHFPNLTSRPDRCTRVPWQGVCCFLLLASAGCLRSVTDSSLASLNVAETSPPAQEEPLAEIEQQLTARVTTKDAQGTISVETTDGWYRRLDVDLASSADGPWRWQNDTLEAFVKASNDAPAQLKRARESQQALIAATATIGLARYAPAGTSQDDLAEIARNTSLPRSVRCAAVETLARTGSLETEARLRELVAACGPNSSGVIQQPEVYAELLAGLARHTAIDHDPLFDDALAAGDVELQLAVLRLYEAAKVKELPEIALALVHHPQGRVRAAVLAVLVAGEHPQALDYLAEATRDADLHVRVAAIELLGKVRDRGALPLLVDLASDGSERHREAAANALIAQEEWTAVERAARDRSYRVRVAVAAGLKDHGTAERVALARRLLADSSAAVQAQMASTLQHWPVELSGPLLIEGMRSSNMLTRKTSATSLASHWSAAQDFPYGAPLAERNVALERLEKQWKLDYPQPVSSALAAHIKAAGLSREELQRLLRRYQAPADRSERWLARKHLEHHGRHVIEHLDALLADGEFQLDEITYRELLPALSPAMGAIEELRSLDLEQRRAAARKLAHEAALEPLPRFAIDRLSGIARTESDPLVWADVLRAASQSSDYVAHELALAALAHGEASVRRQGCHYLARCGTPRQGEALLPLLSDRDPTIVRAAVTALLRCGPLPQREPLYDFLSSADITLQVGAAKTLASWDDARGKAALERLALSQAPATRRLAVAAMGELASREYLNALVRALDDQPSVQLAALEALPKVAGEDVIAKASPAPVNAADKALAWKTWHEQQVAKKQPGELLP